MLDADYEGALDIERAWREGLTPDPLLTVSEWSDRHRMLSSKASAEPGRWRTSRTPYLKAIMDCLSPMSAVERIVFMKAAQLGATEMGNNWIGYVIHHAPGPMMAVSPTVEMAKRNSKQRIDPLIEESPVLAELIAPARSRDAGNTILAKEFRGGVLVMTGANSAVGLRSMPVRYLFLDEVDGYPSDVDGEGDAISLAEARTRTFARRKIFIVSTPTIAGASSIEREYEASDQRRYFLPCPHCSHRQWLRFESRPIPPAVADRVDPAQPLSYQVSQGVGYFGIAAVIEVVHLESGQIWYQSVHGPNYSPGQMTAYNWWPSGWEQMSMDANGIIRHHGVDWSIPIHAIDPANAGLPATGTYRMQVILLAYGYQTFNRSVTSNVLGSGGDTRMSWKPIFLSHMPSLISYTPGMTDGIIPPFEYTYTRSPVLYPWPADGTGILFDAVFDMKNLTTFRFVVRIENRLDFAVGLVVQASGWQAWVILQPGETKHLAGGVSISGMFNWNAYPLHPMSPTYGWERSWGSSYISMYNGQCTIPFSLFLTAPSPPETTPANLPALKATQRWYWDLSGWGPQYEPEWGAIKKYAPDGRYDYEYALQQYNLNAVAITTIDRSITKPSYQPPIDPATYFVTGYQTSPYDWVSPWHKRPWPGYSGWGSLSAPLMVNGERQTWDGSQYVWVPVEAVSISLTRAMMQQVAAMLGVTEYVVMDGDDIRWFVPVAYSPPTYPESFSNVLWIDRFYTRGGTLIDDAAMRNAFQTVITNNAGAWPNYRNLAVHPSVRFGSFLDNGGFEVGDYLLGPNGDMVEVGSLAALSSVSTRFLYYIKPEFR